MSKPLGLLIYGFGGHARSVADVALAAGVPELVFVDANARPGESFQGFQARKDWSTSLPRGWAAFSASGNGETRKRHIEDFERSEWPVATVIAPDATLGRGSVLGMGSFVGRSAHIGPGATVGPGCIINTAAIVEHECAIGDFTHVSVNATIAGRSRIGRLCMIGAGAVVIDSMTVCDAVTIGAGAVVHRSITEAGTYVGVPATLLRKHSRPG